MQRSSGFARFGYVAGLAVLAVSGCGSSGNAPTGDAISAFSIASNTRSVSTDNGTLDVSALDVGALQGTLNSAKTQVVLSAGGKVDLSPAFDGYTSRFVSTPIGGSNSIGILGVSTLQAGMPVSGVASYLGDSQITAQVGSDFYELDGTAQLEADFASGQVSELTLSGLSGQVFPALGATQTVSNVATITLSGINMTGAALSGGRSTSTGGTIVLSGSQTDTVSGQFFGPNAEEAGGVWVIDDSASSGTVVTGDFLTKK